MAELRLCLPPKPDNKQRRFLTVSACLKDFPTCASDRIIDTRSLSIRGERLAVVPGSDHGIPKPAILLGLEYCSIFPILQPPTTVPRSIRRIHPNITAWRSQITGKLILAGEISNDANHSRACMQTTYLPHTSLSSACLPMNNAETLLAYDTEWDIPPMDRELSSPSTGGNTQDSIMGRDDGDDGGGRRSLGC